MPAAKKKAAARGKPKTKSKKKARAGAKAKKASSDPDRGHARAAANGSDESSVQRIIKQLMTGDPTMKTPAIIKGLEAGGHRMPSIRTINGTRNAFVETLKTLRSEGWLSPKAKAMVKAIPV